VFGLLAWLTPVLVWNRRVLGLLSLEDLTIGYRDADP
jgi:hypothetical protein